MYVEGKFGNPKWVCDGPWAQEAHLVLISGRFFHHCSVCIQLYSLILESRCPVIAGQLPLDQSTYSGNLKLMVNLCTQPGHTLKPDVEIADAYFELVIPEHALVLVFLPQEQWVDLTDLICLFCFGCRNNCWQSQLAQFFVVPLQRHWHLFFQCGSKLPEYSTGNRIQWSLCSTENRALEKSVCCCREAITLEIWLGCSQPGLAVAKISRLTFKLMVAKQQIEDSLWQLCEGKRI